VRRAKLYYLRGLTGKAARIREKLTAVESREVLPPDEEAAAAAAAATTSDAEAKQAPAKKADKPKKPKKQERTDKR